MKTEYKINVRRYYYGPRETVTEHLNERAEPWRGSRAEASEEIDAMESANYYLAHNESGRPTYRIAQAEA